MSDLGMLVDAIPLAPPRVSLLTSADVIEGDAWDDHMENGVRFLPEQCAPITLDCAMADGVPSENPESECADDNPPDADFEDQTANYWWSCPDTTAGEGQTAGIDPWYTKLPPPPEEQVEVDAYTVWTGFRCTTLQGAQGDAFAARARRALEAFQSHLIERELWTGAVSQLAFAGENPYLASEEAIEDGTEFGYINALAEMEQRLAECQPGQVGMIHAQPRVVALWVSAGMVIPEANGRRLRTAFGTIVVPGSGYTGDGFTPGEEAPTWTQANESHSMIYGTGLVRVWLGPARRVDTDVVSLGLAASEVDRSLNTTVIRWERPAVATWDQCCHIGMNVRLYEPLRDIND